MNITPTSYTNEVNTERKLLNSEEAGYIQHLWKAKIHTIQQYHMPNILESQIQTTGIPALGPLL